jgi:hypothetical protein
MATREDSSPAGLERLLEAGWKWRGGTLRHSAYSIVTWALIVWADAPWGRITSVRIARSRP